MKKHLLSAAVLVLAATGCNRIIFEKRAECPSWLTVRFVGDIPREASALPFRTLIQTEQPAQSDFLDTPYDAVLPFEELSKTGRAWCVPREQDVKVCLFTQQGNTSLEGHLLTITQGRDCDIIYGDAARVYESATTETDHLELKVKKHFAHFTLRVVGENTNYPFRFRVKGEVDGFDIRDFSPHYGPFVYETIWEGGGYTTYFRAPRQGREDRLILEILDTRTQPEKVFSTVDLTTILVKLRYDWTQDVLEDIHIDFDWTSADISVWAEPWTVKEVFENLII